MSFTSTYACANCGQHLMFEQAPCSCPTKKHSKTPPKNNCTVFHYGDLLEDFIKHSSAKAFSGSENLAADLEASISISRLNELCNYVHELNRRWWTDPSTGEPIVRNKPEMLMLMVSELSEAMEGIRKNLQDTHLPHRKMEEVEMSDLLIRLLDFCGGWGLDLSGATMEKLRYNKTRKDHSNEERLKDGGKKF